MRLGSTRGQYGEHLRQVEEILDAIRDDRSLDDAARRHLIDDALAAANARALSLHAARRQSIEASPLVAHEIEDRRQSRRLARVG